jgi:hypothetical protein
MLVLEQQRHRLDVTAQPAFFFCNTAPSLGRKGTTRFSLKTCAIYWP